MGGPTAESVHRGTGVCWRNDRQRRHAAAGPAPQQGPGRPQAGGAQGVHPARAESAKAQIEFLYTRAKRSTKALAEQLGVSPRTVQRYRAGQETKPQKRLQAALVEETESQWQPQVRAQARERAATSSGMMVEVTAYFGFTCTGSSDDGRERTLTTPISPTYVTEILRLRPAARTPNGSSPGTRA
ncbi:telomere-protecting terminal protein Tpg [Streptomyces avermitilis]|uniref:telomere-protecting terminal protein Tpg n=1 Tax=Streptomyces avermitilis TaxID=33903 RepID=UPI003CD0851E